MTDLRKNGSKFAIIGTDPCFTMTVENEAPGKRSTCDLQGASKCSSKASVGCCRRFHWRAAPVFIWWRLFSLASGLIRSKHRCSRRTCKRTLIQQSKANNETSTDQRVGRCMQTLTECSDCSCACDRRDRSYRYRSCGAQRSTCDLLNARPVDPIIMMIGRASFIGLIPRRWITIAATQWQFLATSRVLDLQTLSSLDRPLRCLSKFAIADRRCSRGFFFDEYECAGF